jgi:elongation factor Ts
MEIKAAQVKQLRDMSGVAMMDCKKALVEAKGDLDKALDLLRANSALKAEKKATRIAADGVVKVVSTKTYSTIIEINSETDFAAKDEKFNTFVNEVIMYLSENKISHINELNETDIELKRKTLVQSIGENIQLRRLQTLDIGPNEISGTYNHSDSKLSAIVIMDGENQALARDIAMHVSAMNPLCLSQEFIDKDVLDREKAIFEAQAKDSGKPPEIMNKIIDGKIKRFLSDVSLVSQSFIKDPDKTVDELLSDAKSSIKSYVRFKVGEGIEVEGKNFADEVAEQLK